MVRSLKISLNFRLLSWICWECIWDSQIESQLIQFSADSVQDWLRTKLSQI